MTVDFKFIMNALHMFVNDLTLREVIAYEMEYQLGDVSGFADYLLDDLNVSQDYYDTVLENIDTFMDYVDYNENDLEVDSMDFEDGDALITYRIPLTIDFDSFAIAMGV